MKQVTVKCSYYIDVDYPDDAVDDTIMYEVEVSSSPFEGRVGAKFDQIYKEKEKDWIAKLEGSNEVIRINNVGVENKWKIYCRALAPTDVLSDKTLFAAFARCQSMCPEDQDPFDFSSAKLYLIDLHTSGPSPKHDRLETQSDPHTLAVLVDGALYFDDGDEWMLCPGVDTGAVLDFVTV